MQADFAAAFATRTRDAWADHFAATDACVTPVLAMIEAPDHPHNQARGTFVRRNGLTQPAPAPRLDRMAGAITQPDAADIGDIISRWS